MLWGLGARGLIHQLIDRNGQFEKAESSVTATHSDESMHATLNSPWIPPGLHPGAVPVPGHCHAIATCRLNSVVGWLDGVEV